MILSRVVMAIAMVLIAVPVAAQSRSIDIRGFAMAGGFTFAADQSFDAILDEPSAPFMGGGARIGFPIGGLFVDVAAWRLRAEGQRVFVANGVVYPLHIPATITLTPLEVSAGWRFYFPRVPRLLPYVAGGFTTMKYEETSDFATGNENVDESFDGYHLFGGVEYRITRWLGAAGEFQWTTVPDAIGESGVSAAFDEQDLGGTAFRFKITIGR